MNKVILIVLAVLLLGTAGFYGVKALRGYSFDEGIIVEKKFVPEHTTTAFRTQTVGKITTQVPYTIYHDDAWYLVVEGAGSNGKVHTKNFRVDDYTYRQKEIGMPVYTK